MSVVPFLNAKEQEYVSLAESGVLHQIQTTSSVNGIVTKDEMVNLYKGNFARKGTDARVIYDELRSVPKHGICPLCGKRIVSQLDHYLPETLYPHFSVTPANLVPACSDCNKIKLAHNPTRVEELTLHPYFDNIDNEIWLNARVIEGLGFHIQYFANPPATLSREIVSRIKFHFEKFELGNLYSANAAAEISEQQHFLQCVHRTGGKEELRKYFREQIQSRSLIDKNSWQVAMYQALLTSEWFCENGLFSTF